MHHHDLVLSSLAPGPILVVAPHPDDECLGAAGFISMAVAAGHEVHVLFFTSGDGFVQDAQRYYLSLTVTPEEYLHLGYERQKEAVNALTSLGVESSQIHFLGFPDGGLDALYRSHWFDPFESPTTTLNAVPYLDAAGGALTYRGHDLWLIVHQIMDQVQPRIVVLPHPIDGHPDHWATHSFARLALLSAEAKGRSWALQATVLSYLVHWPAWPMPLGLRTHLEQRPPSGLNQTSRIWRKTVLNQAAIESKQRTMTIYTSQMELIKPYMLAFVRSTEAFEVDPTRTIKGAEGKDPRLPLQGWNSADTIAYARPQGDFMTRMAKGVNIIDRLEWSCSEGYGYLRLRWQEHRDRPNLRAVVRMHWPGGEAPDTWCFDLETGELIGEAICDLRSRVAQQTLAVSWPLSLWQGRSWLMLGVEVLEGSRVVGRSGYLAYHWVQTPLPEGMNEDEALKHRMDIGGHGGDQRPGGSGATAGRRTIL